MVLKCKLSVSTKKVLKSKHKDGKEKMKYTVKYRKQKHDAFANVGEIYKATRGEFAGTAVFRDRIFNTYEEAESVRKVYAEKFGAENTKITERKG